MSLVFFARRSGVPGLSGRRTTKRPLRKYLVLEQLERRDAPAVAALTGVTLPTQPATPPPTKLAFANVKFGAWSPGYTWVDVQVADINGTGIDDVIGMIQQTGQWWAAVSNGASGFTDVMLTTWSPFVNWQYVHTGDFYGNGRADIVGWDPGTGEWWIAVSTGASSYYNLPLANWSPVVTWTNVNVADLNGDGKADIVGMVAQNGQWWATVSTPTGWATTLWDVWSPGVPWVDVQVGDLTGNGQDDIVGLDPQTGQWWAGISTGTGFTTSLWGTWSMGYTWENVMLADVTGDGKADLVGMAAQTGQWWVGESTGTSFTNSLWATWSPAETWVDVQVADFTNDGYMDIAGRTLDSGQWWVGLSNGTKFNTTLWATWSPLVTWTDVHAANLTTGSSTDLVGMVASTGEWWAALSNAPANANEGYVGDQMLNEVAATAASSGDAGAAAQYGKQLTFDSENRVNLNVRATQPQFVDSLEANVENLGMIVTDVNYVNSLITGYLSPSKISSLPSLLHFAAATANFQPMFSAGQVPNENGPVILANTFTSMTGDDGTGETIGIISNSVNQYPAPGAGLAESYAVGALNPAKVKVLQDGPAGSDDEGRAMMEVAYDVAPGANLDFDTTGASPAAAANAILTLAAAGATSIADDFSFPDEPMFNDGIIAQAVDTVVANGVVYATAAGNAGNQAYTAPWKGVSTTVGGISGTFMDFGGGNALQDFTLPVGASMTVSLQWDAAFLEGGSSLPNFTIPNSLSAYVTDPNGNILPMQSYTTPAQNSGEADQFIQFSNPGPATNFAMAFQLASGPAPTMIKWIDFSNPLFPHMAAVGEGAATTFGHAAATGAITSGAISYANPQPTTPTTIEPYSALGANIEILFDVNGNRLATPDIRQKPDLTGPDNVDTSFFLPGQDTDVPPDGWPNFTGTSATSEQVAAAAALIREENPAATPAQIEAHFKATAIPFGNPGYTGAGLLQITPLPPSTPPPTVEFVTASESVDASAGSFAITVTLSAAASVNVSVPFTLGGTAVAGTDYTGVTPSPLVIAAGQTSGAITGSLIATNAFVNPTLTFTLGKPVFGTLGPITVNTLNIIDDQATAPPPPPPPPPPPILRGPPDDIYEPDDTSNTATNFGFLTGTQSYSGLVINGSLVDGYPVYQQNFYRWTMSASGTFTATMSNIMATGGIFQEKILVLEPDNSLQLLATSPLAVASTQTVSASVAAGQTIFLWVQGISFTVGSSPVGTYDFSVSLQ